MLFVVILHLKARQILVDLQLVFMAVKFFKKSLNFHLSLTSTRKCLLMFRNLIICYWRIERKNTFTYLRIIRSKISKDFWSFSTILFYFFDMA